MCCKTSIDSITSGLRVKRWRSWSVLPSTSSTWEVDTTRTVGSWEQNEIAEVREETRDWGRGGRGNDVMWEKADDDACRVFFDGAADVEANKWTVTLCSVFEVEVVTTISPREDGRIAVASVSPSVGTEGGGEGRSDLERLLLLTHRVVLERGRSVIRESEVVESIVLGAFSLFKSNFHSEN